MRGPWRALLIGPWASPCLVAMSCFGALLSGLYPSLHWYDTGEWIAAPRTLSLAHPPGHPLTVLSTHISQLLPWLDAYARANLASALWLSLASALCCAAMRALIPRRDGRAELLSIAVGLYLPALPLVWLQGVRAEVYAAQCALSALTLLAWASYHSGSDRRWLLMGGLSLGLQASNHTLLAVAVAAPFCLWLTLGATRGLRSGRATAQSAQSSELTRLSPKALALSLSGAALGLSLYLFLPLRGRAGGVEGWGWVSDLTSFWETLSAQVWRRSVIERSAELELTENLTRFSAFMIEQLGSLSALLALGLTLLATLRWARRGAWAPALILSAVWVSVALTKLSYPFLEVNPDFSGYLSAGAPSLCLLLGLACWTCSRRAAPLLMLALLLGASTQPRHHEASQSYAAEAWLRSLTDELPPRGALWSAHYATHFGLSALRVVEGWRPDTSLIFRGYWREPWAQRRLQRSLGPMSAAEDAPPSPLQPRARFEAEGPVDPFPLLRERARAVGLTWALSPWAQPASLAELSATLDRARQRMDLTRGGLEQLSIDTCYALALYHEAQLTWLNTGPSSLTEAPVAELRALHLSQRDHWLSLLP